MRTGSHFKYIKCSVVSLTSLLMFDLNNSALEANLLNFSFYGLSACFGELQQSGKGVGPYGDDRLATTNSLAEMTQNSRATMHVAKTI